MYVQVTLVLFQFPITYAFLRNATYRVVAANSSAAFEKRRALMQPANGVFLCVYVYCVIPQFQLPIRILGCYSLLC